MGTVTKDKNLDRMTQLKLLLVLMILFSPSKSLPAKDNNLFSMIAKFKTDILQFLTHSFSFPKKESQPQPKPPVQEHYHHTNLPSLQQIPHDLPQGVPHQVSPYPQADRPHLPLKPQPVAIVDIDIPVETQIIVTEPPVPVVVKEVQVDIAKQNINQKEKATDVSNDHIDEQVVVNIPADLWREDINGIKKHSKKNKKIKKVRLPMNKKNSIENATPSDPELMIE